MGNLLRPMIRYTAGNFFISEGVVVTGITLRVHFICNLNIHVMKLTRFTQHMALFVAYIKLFNNMGNGDFPFLP